MALLPQKPLCLSGFCFLKQCDLIVVYLMLKIKKAILFVMGIIFIILGLLGLFLPILQGILFLFIGTLLISTSNPEINAFIHKFALKYPNIKKALEKTENYIAKFINKI